MWYPTFRDTIPKNHYIYERRRGMEATKLSLKEWRRARGLSQEALAKTCGVHLNTYRQWEQNPGKIKIDDAVRIADTLNISLDAIILPSDTTICGKAESVVI
jgi:transcriptional regulator with XRE-family HTH domain